MKKLLTLLFTGLIAFSLAIPAFAQYTGTQEAPKAEKTKKKKGTTKGGKVGKKKAKKESKTGEASKQ